MREIKRRHSSVRCQFIKHLPTFDSVYHSGLLGKTLHNVQPRWLSMGVLLSLISRWERGVEGSFIYLQRFESQVHLPSIQDGVGARGRTGSRAGHSAASG